MVINCFVSISFKKSLFYDKSIRVTAVSPAMRTITQRDSALVNRGDLANATMNETDLRACIASPVVRSLAVIKHPFGSSVTKKGSSCYSQGKKKEPSDTHRAKKKKILLLLTGQKKRSSCYSKGKKRSLLLPTGQKKGSSCYSQGEKRSLLLLTGQKKKDPPATHRAKKGSSCYSQSKKKDPLATHRAKKLLLLTGKQDPPGTHG